MLAHLNQLRQALKNTFLRKISTIYHVNLFKYSVYTLDYIYNLIKTYRCGPNLTNGSKIITFLNNDLLV